MANPDQERMDALSEAIIRLTKKQEQYDKRLTRVEASLSLQPIVPEPRPAPPPQPPPAPLPAVLQRVEATPSVSAGTQPPEATPTVSAGTQALETNIGLKWANPLRAITLVFGAAFRFNYAVDHPTIGPARRVRPRV